MDQPPKQTIAQSYDEIAPWYLDWVTTQHTPREHYTEAVLASTTPSNPPKILELGCASGIPITRLLLARNCAVTANDLSPRHIAMARQHCPEADYHLGDMTLLSFPANHFDGAVSFYTLFHLPRSEQGPMLSRIYDWLRPGASFAFNLATVDEAEIHGEFLGRGMFWSSFDVEGSRRMVEGVGWEVVRWEVLESSGEGGKELEEGDPDAGVSFLWVLVRKPGGGGKRGEVAVEV